MINGEMFYKKSEPHKASVTGDTVGDPFKDTSGPSMNILIKLMSIVSLVIAPYIAVVDDGTKQYMETVQVKKCIVDGVEMNCDSLEAAHNKDVNELQGVYKVDGAHSAVDFSIKHIVTNTKGTALIDSGWVNLQNAGTKIFIQIDAKTLNTQNSFRDEHLQKEEFFDAAKYPKIIFEGTEIVKDSTSREYAYAVKGNLTIKGVVKPSVIHFNYVGSEEREGDKGKYTVAGFEGRTVINRTEWNIGEGGGLGNDVVLTITLEAIKH
jgi:K(+)-stimulated pyrophosphate-energized sodium pump